MVGFALHMGLGRAARSEAGQPQFPPNAGPKHLVMLGQSELHRLFLSSHADVGNAGTVTDEAALEIWWYDFDTSSPNNATGVRRDAVTNATPVSRWAVEMSNALAALAPGASFKVACLLFAGTGLDDLLNDTQISGGRYWTRNAPFNGDKEVYDQFVADTGIIQPDAAFMSWQNTDSTQLQFQIGDAWWTALTGTGLDDGAPVALGASRHNVTYDHFFSEMWDTETVPFALLMHRYDILTSGQTDWARFRDVRVSLDRMIASGRNQARAVPIQRGVDPVAYENGYDVIDASHPRKTDDGATKFAQQLAYNMARLTGAVLDAPRLETVTWSAADVTLASDAGALTTTRALRSEAVPAGQPKVAQLFFRSADAPEVLHPVPDLAIALSGGSIVISATQILTEIGAGRSSFVRGDRIEFAPSAAGANDAQDQTDDTWRDYPGIAHTALELVPLQPEAGVLVCDLPPISTPTNLLQDFGTWAANEALFDQGEGWFVPSVNRNFDSNSGELDASGLTGGLESTTIVVDLDRGLGQDGGSSTQVNFRDVAGAGHQRVRAVNLWGDVVVDSPGSVVTSFGHMPIPGGRTRIWAYVDATAGGRHMLYLNNSGTGGAYGFAGVYDGQLSVAEIAGL